MKKTLLIICLIILSSCEKEETIINFLIKTEAFQSNTNCMNGGISIHSGLDLNNNTILEENEITDIEYICNGEDGVDGENGLQVLVIINDEIAGDNCQ